MTRATLLLAALALVTACGGDGVGGAQLALTVNDEGWNEIWLMAADGSDRTRLTETEPPENDAAGSTGPSWSPDGTQIAFQAQIGERTEDPRLTEIYVMDADGSNRRRLTTNDDVDTAPSWSPDGTRIAFVRVRELGTEIARGGIVVVEVDGGREEQITESAWPTHDLTPAWSPDGSQIAFARAAPGPGVQLVTELHVLTLETGALRTVARDGVEPSWSPDGTRIAFTSFVDRNGQTCFHECGASGELHVVDIDTGDETRLTDSEASDQSPAWSPDGRTIAFVSDRSDREGHAYEIYVMDADGGNVERLTDNDVWDLEPAWRP